MSKCNCCHCKDKRKEMARANPKCLNKNCPGHYVSTSRVDKSGLRILECNVCGEEGV